MNQRSCREHSAAQTDPGPWIHIQLAAVLERHVCHVCPAAQGLLQFPMFEWTQRLQDVETRRGSFASVIYS